MIPIHCHTNRDGFELAKWPKEVVTPIQKGDYIEAEDKRSLRVVEITHAIRDSSFDGNARPIIFVELNL